MASELAALAVSYGLSPREISGFDDEEWSYIAPHVYRHVMRFHRQNLKEQK